MDVSCALRGGLIATSLPQQHLPGTVLYPSKENAWQPVVTPLPLLPTPTAEIPKESIIANTDFTTTSVIAKRRLSSKKRRKQRDSVEESEISSAQQSPTVPESTSPNEQDYTSSYTNARPHLLSSSSSIPVSSITSPSSTITTVPQHSLITPQHIATIQQGGVVGPAPMLSGNAQYIALSQNNQVLSQIPPELAYQMLQQEGHTIITTSSGPTGQYVETSRGQAMSHSTHYDTSSSQLSNDVNTNQVMDGHEATLASSSSNHSHTTASVQALEQQLHHHHQQQLQHQLHQHQLHQIHLQQQQQLAMMQMYRIQGLIPGPVSVVQDIHHQLQLQAQGSMPIVGHAHQPHPNQLMSVPVQTLYATQPHSVPITTALAPPELLLQVQNGSWVTPTATPMFGSCIVNPIQPGLLATSLVK